METLLPIRDIQFTAGSRTERASGRLGWIHLQYGELLLDGLALLRTRDGRFVLSFPTPNRRVAHGSGPIGAAGSDVREQIEAQVIAELRWSGAIQ